MKAAFTMGKINVPGAKKDRNPIEDLIQLEDYVNFTELNGGVGAALLSDNRKFQFKYGFELTEAVHPTLPNETMQVVAEKIVDAIKAMPEDESITVVQRVVPDNSQRLKYYGRLADNAPTPLFSEFVKSAASPFQYYVNLDPHKRRTIARQRFKRKKIYIYVTATPNTSGGDGIRSKSDMVVKKAVQLTEKLLSFTGVAVETNEDTLESLFLDAQTIYENWVNTLDQMGLRLKPMTMNDMVKAQWEEFNDTPLRELPQYIEWDGRQLRYHQYDDIHTSSWLFSDQYSIPKATRNYVWRRRTNGEPAFTGVVTLKDKPAQWKTRKDQLEYLYRKCSGLEDYSIVLSFRKASEHVVKRNVEILQRQAMDCERSAEKKGLPSTFSSRINREAAAAQEAIHDGDIPINMSLAVTITKPSVKLLETACKSFSKRFPLPATFEIEREYTAITWMQCFPQLSFKSPLFAPYRRVRGYKASCMPAFMPVMAANSPEFQGLEFITKDEMIPYYLDVLREHRHIMISAITRSGKSVLFAQILMLAMCSDVPMVVIDYPKEDGESTFGPITKLAGEHGAYLNIATESNNFICPPDFSALAGYEDEIARRMSEIKGFIIDIFMIIMFGANNTNIDSREQRSTKALFGNLLTEFYNNPEIKERFANAQGAPIGSPEWRNVPTLRDFTNTCTPDKIKALLNLDRLDEELRLSINEINLRFRAFMETTVGRSMSSPTTIPTDAKLLVFAFKGISSNDDAAILMASASAAAMRRTLSSFASIFFMDEAAILSKFPALMAQVAKISANGAKSGIRLMIALQTPSSIAYSEFGDEIIGNISTHLIGRVAPADAKNYVKILDVPEHIIAKNTSKDFVPNIYDGYSNWLSIDKGEATFVRSYAPPLLLAAVANNRDEEAAKAAFLRAYDDPIEALRHFAIELIASAQERRMIRYPKTEEPLYDDDTDEFFRERLPRDDSYAERQENAYQERYFSEV